LVYVLNSIVHRELVVNFLAILLGNELCLFTFFFRNWNLEFFGNFTSNWVI
jgi:hypothetical protein